MPLREPLILTTGIDPVPLAAALEEAWRQDRPVGLAAAQERCRLEAALLPNPLAWPEGLGGTAGVVIGSGGSAGLRRWCWQPLAHLQASATACGAWLRDLDLDPGGSLVLNPLPLHHMSGLLPLVRSRLWGAELRWLVPSLLRDPAALASACPLPPEKPVLLSVVPTQLRRLMASPEGLAWLRRCTLIWVGGASLPADLAATARAAALPLAPCYGATETAAMVCALPPRRFLAGEDGCGHPLGDVALRIDGATGALEVRSARLSPGTIADGLLHPLPLLPSGWWRSGDGARLGPGGLRVLGRLDGAIHSGGETVFPEQLEARLMAQARARDLPLEAVLLLPQADPAWGHRLAALVRTVPPGQPAPLIQALRAIVATWPPAERPCRWHPCPRLEPSSAGKWQRRRWQAWLDAKEAR